MEVDKTKFQGCMEIFCSDGFPGVCEFATSLQQECLDDFGVLVEELPSFCGKEHPNMHRIYPLNTIVYFTTVTDDEPITILPPPLTTISESMCTGEPSQDERAIETCQFIIDSESSFSVRH